MCSSAPRNCWSSASPLSCMQFKITWPSLPWVTSTQQYIRYELESTQQPQTVMVATVNSVHQEDKKILDVPLMSHSTPICHLEIGPRKKTIHLYWNKVEQVPSHPIGEDEIREYWKFLPKKLDYIPAKRPNSPTCLSDPDLSSSVCSVHLLFRSRWTHK